MQTAPDTSMVRDLLFLVIGAAIGAVLGFVGSYWVQRSGQNRAWKREYLLRNVERIYVPLFEEIHTYIDDIKECTEFHPYGISEAHWNKIRNDYRDIFVEDALRIKMNKLYDTEFQKYHDNFWNATIKIRDMWFERRIKVKVEANGHTFTYEPTRELNGNKFNINLEDAKNELTELIRTHIFKFIFLNKIESEGYIIQQLEHRLKYSLSKEEYLKEIQLLKEEVESQEEIHEFKRFREQILHKLNETKNMLKERIKRPYEAKL